MDILRLNAQEYILVIMILLLFLGVYRANTYIIFIYIYISTFVSIHDHARKAITYTYTKQILIENTKPLDAGRFMNHIAAYKKESDAWHFYDVQDVYLFYGISRFTVRGLLKLCANFFWPKPNTLNSIQTISFILCNSAMVIANIVLPVFKVFCI